MSLIQLMNNNRYQLNLSNVTVGIFKRIEVSLEKNLNKDDYVIKKEENAIIISQNILGLTKRVIKSVDEKIIIDVKEVKEKHRYVFYLENLDCGNCAAKIERICKRNIVHDMIVVDFATLKIVIETTKKYDKNELKMLVQEYAEMVDPHIECKEKLKKTIDSEKNDFRIDKKKKREFILGISIFAFFFILKNIVKFVFSYNEIWIYVFIYVGYVPSYFLLAKDVLFGALNNLKNGRVFDEKFLMTLATVMALCTGLYDEAIFVIVFYSIGELCQQYAVNYSRKSISALVNIRPEKAIVEVDGRIQELDPESVVVGDIICCNTGDKIALDGVVINGHASIDAQALTGESKAIEVSVNDEVLSGSVVIDGNVKIKVKSTYENSMVSKILNMVENASSKKSKSENFISRFAKYYTPVIVCLAALIAVFLPIVSDKYEMAWYGGWKDSLRVAMIFLVVSCPCALVISIPLGFFGGIGAASKEGILVKGSNYLEALTKADIFVFDKTGTLTKGSFAVKKVVSLSDLSTDDLLRLSAYSEIHSNHVIGQSIIKAYGKEIDASVVEMKEVSSKRGIIAMVEGKEVILGRKVFFDNLKIKSPLSIEETDALLIALDKKVVGYLVIEDQIREESKMVINGLRKRGVQKIIMITGDSKKVAKNVSDYLGIDEYYSDMNPIDKVNVLQKIKEDNPQKKVCFVGDGINDAPVISSSDIGIAMGGLGNEATMQIADVVLVNQNMTRILKAVDISKKTRKIVIENIILALTVKFIFLCLSPLNFGYVINTALVYGAIFADVGVSLIAIINSLRATRV